MKHRLKCASLERINGSAEQLYHLRCQLREASLRKAAFRCVRNSRHSVLCWILHCLLKTTSMELLKLAITLYVLYVTSIAISYVTLTTQMHAASLNQGCIIVTPCCMVLRRNRLIGYSVCRTNWHASSRNVGTWITMSSVCCAIFTSCRYEAGSPFKVGKSMLHCT